MKKKTKKNISLEQAKLFQMITHYNFRGKENKFWFNIVKGLKKFLESPFK